MSHTIYSATGCARCKIVKGFMDERGVDFVEKDMKAEGKEDFRKFYAANRPAIWRGPDGIEFPILTDGAEIRQGLAVCLAWLTAGSGLDGFFRIGPSSRSLGGRDRRFRAATSIGRKSFWTFCVI